MIQSASVVAVTLEVGLQSVLSILSNRQRRYRLRLQAARVTQPGCNNLLASLRKGDEQEQLGEQPENENE